MSLKGFHIFFITITTLMAVALGFWCVWLHLVSGSGFLGGAAAFFLSAVALLVYGVWFWRKMKRLRLIT